MTTKTYIATAKAGRRISGQPNPGVGNTIRLTEAQAAHELRMGTIVAADNRADRKAAAAKKPTSAERAAAKEAEASGKKSSKRGGKKAKAPGDAGSGAESGQSDAPVGDTGGDAEAAQQAQRASE